MKRQPTQQEEIFAIRVSDEELILKKIKNHYNSKQTKNQTQRGTKDLNRHFSIKDIQMVNKLTKICSASLIMREI